MLRPRLIPSLLIQQGDLVKTKGFRAPKYVGDPLNAVRIFSEKDADEILVCDIDATTTGSPIEFGLISELAGESRMPMTYVGGVRTADELERLVSIGVEKVGLSSAALGRPDLIRECATGVGRQSVAVVLDVQEGREGREVFTHSGSKGTGLDPVVFARQGQDLGAGEVVINSIGRDGMRVGYDIPLVSELRRTLEIPVTCLGGAGSLTDVADLYREVGVVGAAAGSLFVFHGRFDAVLISYPSWQERDELYRLSLGSG
jgi:Imidazoleglycerol-phosphate synthase